MLTGEPDLSVGAAMARGLLDWGSIVSPIDQGLGSIDGSGHIGPRGVPGSTYPSHGWRSAPK